jgi:hypothetical protein
VTRTGLCQLGSLRCESGATVSRRLFQHGSDVGKPARHSASVPHRREAGSHRRAVANPVSGRDQTVQNAWRASAAAGGARELSSRQAKASPPQDVESRLSKANIPKMRVLGLPLALLLAAVCLASSEARPVCPNGEPLVQCFVDPCRVNECPRGTQCVANYCGGKSADACSSVDIICSLRAALLRSNCACL